MVNELLLFVKKSAIFAAQLLPPANYAATAPANNNNQTTEKYSFSSLARKLQCSWQARKLGEASGSKNWGTRV